MSYILEALRKAERERRSGRVPSLDTIHPPRARARRLIWPWALGIALLVNGAVLGLVWRSRNPVAPPADTLPSAPAVGGTPSPDGPRLRKEPAAPAPAPGVPAASLPDPAVSAPTAGRPAPSDRAGGPGAVPRAGTGSAAALPPPGDDRPGGTPGEPRRAVGVGDAPQQKAQPVMTQVVPVPPEARATGTGARKPTGGPESPGPGVPPAAARLTLDVLVYSGEPAERLVFINNRKYVEGQAVDGAFVIEAITAEGAILSSAEGQRFILRPKLNPYVRP